LKKYLLILILIIEGFSFEGYFEIERDCSAYSSIKKKTDPIELEVGKTYKVVAKNRENATHYQLEDRKWVAKECGELVSKDSEYVLAISWQNAFCQLNQNRKECRSEYDSTIFTLHGLWPKDRLYCDISQREIELSKKRKNWCKLPKLELSKETFRDLSEVMPSVESCLQRYEWTKHGSCYSQTEEEYYSESIALINQINRSAVREFFNRNVGKKVSIEEIKAKFGESFGYKNKIKLNCKGGLITEIQINLKGEIEENSTISELLRDASDKSSRCRSGVIDPVGF
jgi:ribonuclease T2